LFVAAFAVALVSGLRIAAETPERTWINLLDVVLPRASVWTLHMQAAVVLVAVALGYVVYLVRSGLVRRVKLDKVRLRGLFGRGQSRLGALIALMYWIFFVTMAMLLFSGGLLYFGLYSGYDVAMLHWVGTWVILAFVVLHVLTQYKSGGLSQLLRIFRPAPLPAPPPRLDAIELLGLLAEQSARRPQSESLDEPLPEAPSQPLQPRADARRERAPEADPTPRPGPGPARSRNPTLQANAFVVAAAAAITGASFIVATDQFAVDRLRVQRIGATDVPTLDGDTSDRAWRGVRPFSLLTGEGGNFDGKGETRITVRAVHDGTFAYFLFTWEDSTRSLKHLPLVKEADGWHLLHSGFRIGDEHQYNEDKFSVLLTTSDATLAGDRTFHAGPRPVASAPATMSGRGLHFTADGYVDVWQWKATSGGASGWMDDAHIQAAAGSDADAGGKCRPYRGGFARPERRTTRTISHRGRHQRRPQRSRLIAPLRLPKLVATTTAAMGAVDLDANHGESDGARWFMTEQESVPYSADADARIPTGTVIPGVIVNGEFSGDRPDIRCAARWASGYWALEVKRRLDSSSKFDVPIRTGVSMRLAAFDHSQIRHTRHVRPIRLEVE
jgi:hypothetical protein